MVRDVAFGQYFPGNSLLHRLDPRLKIVVTLAYIVLLFVVKEWIGFAGITRIEGSYFNVVGFPVQRVYEALLKLL